MSDKLYVITTEEKLKEALGYIRSNIGSVNHLCAFDVESNGKCPISNKIIGYSISLFEDEGFYFPFLAMTDDKGICTESPNVIPKEGGNNSNELLQCVTDEFISIAVNFIKEINTYKTIMHNASFDVIITRRNYNIDLIDSLYCDTLMLKHTLDCDKPHGLKECGAKYFGEDAKDEQEELGGSVVRNGGKWTKTDKWIWFGDVYYVGKYAAMDTCLTLKLYNYLDPQLDSLDLREFFYSKEVMPLMRYATIPMKDNGLKIDITHFRKSKLRIQAEISDIDMQIRAEISDVTGPIEQKILDSTYPPRSGGEFALNLILEAGLPLPTNKKTGKFSVAKKIREEWVNKCIKSATEDQIKVIWYIDGVCDKVPSYLIHRVQRRMWQDKKDAPIINLNSAKQFEYIVGKKWGITSPEKTSSGDQSFTASIIETIAINRMMELENLSEDQAKDRFEDYMECSELPSDADWFIKYLRKKKLEKLVNTFIDGIMDKQVNGRVHTNMLQFGTTSGRYSSNSPNMQQLPAHSALGEVIKRGFIP